MNWLNNLKVRQKLFFLIIVLLAGVICIGVIGHYFLDKTNATADKIYNENLIAVKLVNENRANLQKVEADIYSMLLTKNETRNQELMNDITKRTKDFDNNTLKYEKLPLNNKIKAELSAMKNDLSSYNNIKEETIKLAGQNKNDEAYALYDQQGRILTVKLANDLQAIAEDTDRAASVINNRAKEDFVFANILFAAIVGLTIVLGIVLGWLVTKQISTRLAEVVSFLNILADGNFSQDVPEKSMADESEFGEVSRAVSAMVKNIRKLVQNLTNASQQLAASSEQLNASAEQSAQASNQVAGSVTEVAHGSEQQVQLSDKANNVVEQIAKAIGQVSLNTQTVSGAAEKTASTADAGEKIIQKAVKQMKLIQEKTDAMSNVVGELENKSKQIGQIVDAISNISGQTNLLALNAAIEAARAGSAGKGFAVVAEEVRKLAEQSQDAAKKITDLINEVQIKTNGVVTVMGDSKNHVTEGSKVVSDAGDNFEQIYHMVCDMTSQIQKNSAAVEKITNNTKEVVGAVQKINDASKKNSGETQNISAATEEQSASVEEIASASQHLAKMAEKLQANVVKFKV
ncbi:methyl-accepting chemotaxis protein [Pectinatus sottacetonis]|uniref:methyl-accepting chemotaxis protein n=1 Tax=Pectinatus sottacetonis TaxID=1002795 RepID=UPI0018C6F27C|nr:methyl-accepting chemotaxis protein [Pectinatus sottacetonis]